MSNVQKEGRRAASHTQRGGVLDLILVDKGIDILDAGVGGSGVEASDHRMVWASVAILGMVRPMEPMRWRGTEKPNWQ